MMKLCLMGIELVKAAVLLICGYLFQTGGRLSSGCIYLSRFLSVL